ncbi:hypothetical protein J0Q07_001066 [Vibrio cholerae]|nr:hypothetical protein [Vibrio cholerae]
MALLKDYAKYIPGISEPVVFKNAYWRLSNIEGDKTSLLVNVEIRESSDADGALGLFAFHFEPDPHGKNYHEQAYDHLKTLKDFSNAIDC